MCDTNMSRAMLFMVAQAMDGCTNHNDWSLYSDLTFSPRAEHLHWMLQCKFCTAKNVNNVINVMLNSCGGSGYKTELGLERLFRDGKAAWVMGPSNEVIRQIVGKRVLMGSDEFDFWQQRCNDRSLHHELKKMGLDERRKLAKKLLEEADAEERGDVKHPYQETDFENPFNTKSPTYDAQAVVDSDGVSHAPALTPDAWTSLKLVSRRDVSDRMAAFVFALPKPTDHMGCLPGQYLVIRVNIKGKEQTRYFSPVSRPNDYGRVELVLCFETQGLISQYFKDLKPGDEMDFQGPCGGFEYEPNQLDELTLIASGGGITPGMQLIRCIMNDPKDKTHIKLIYFSENYNEILYKEELDQYAGHDSRLNIVYTLGEAPEEWEGEEGNINTDMIDKHVSKPNGIKTKIVMCGGPNMSISCLHSLRSLSFPSDCIFIYGQFGTEQIKAVFGRNVKLSGHRCDNVL